MRILLACCSSIESPAPNRLESCLETKPNWKGLLRLAESHGVTPLLARALQFVTGFVPREILMQLDEKARSTTYANLVRVKELFRVVNSLENRNIAVVPYKGPALAAMVYGDIWLREFSDLDLLVRRCDVLSAIDVLSGLGYTPEYDLAPRLQQEYLESACEYNLQHKESGIRLELHWQIVPRQFSLQVDVERIWLRLGTFAIGASRLRCLRAEDLLLVLSVHAAKHLWGRLIWIADIAGVISRSPDLDWDEICGHATSMGARRILLISLATVAGLFGLQLPHQIETLIARDHGVERLSNAVMRDILQPEPQIRSSISRHIALMRARESSADKYRYFYRTLSGALLNTLARRRYAKSGLESAC